MGCNIISLRETTIINNIDAILHGFMLQIIYTTIIRVKRYNRGINITYDM